MQKSVSRLIAAFLTTGASMALAQTLVYEWDHTAKDWLNPPVTVANGQMTISTTCGRYDADNVWATWAGEGAPLKNSEPLAEHTTVEARFDLVGADQNDAWAGVNFWWSGDPWAGYIFWKDEDEIVLQKYVRISGETRWSVFFYQTNQPIKNENVTMVLSLTRITNDVRIDLRVLDRDDNNALLFEHTVTDTPRADTVDPMGEADRPGIPWPITRGPDDICANLEYRNPEHVPNGGTARVTFSNIQVWRYQSPQLAIERAVILSWPATAALFVLESSPRITGPWTTLDNPLIRTNASQIEASVRASQSSQLFRLRFLP